jgi:hypothetical protein
MIFSVLPCHLLGKLLKYIISTVCKTKTDNHCCGVLSEIREGGEMLKECLCQALRFWGFLPFLWFL